MCIPTWDCVNINSQVAYSQDDEGGSSTSPIGQELWGWLFLVQLLISCINFHLFIDVYACFAWVYVCTTYVPSAREGQKKALDTLHLELHVWQLLCRCWEPNPSSREKQSVFFTTEPFVQCPESQGRTVSPGMCWTEIKGLSVHVPYNREMEDIPPPPQSHLTCLLHC